MGRRALWACERRPPPAGRSRADLRVSVLSGVAPGWACWAGRISLI